MPRIDGPRAPSEIPTEHDAASAAHAAPADPTAPTASAAPAAPAARVRSAEAERAHGRTVTAPDGTVLRSEEWRVKKLAHVNMIHAFTERYDCAGSRVLSLLSDVNFARGVYARAEVMSLVNDHLAPFDAQGKPKSPEWAAYMLACDRGASELEKNRLFFRAHNVALEVAKKDPAYAAARAAADRSMLTLCDATLAAADELEKKLLKPGADANAIVMGGVTGWLEAHAKAGVIPITLSDLDLVMRASDMSPLEVALDKMAGREQSDEPLMARGMKTFMIMQERFFRSRVDVVRGFAEKIMRRFRGDG